MRGREKSDEEKNKKFGGYGREEKKKYYSERNPDAEGKGKGNICRNVAKRTTRKYKIVRNYEKHAQIKRDKHIY